MFAYLFFVMAGLCIGTIGVFAKMVGDAVSPFVLGFYRVFFALLLLLIVSPLLDKTTFQIKKRNLKTDALIGFMFAFNFTATNVAYIFASVQSVALILSITPIFVLFFAWLLLKEKITKTKGVTITLALVGLIILNPFRPEGLLGNVLALIIVATGGLMFVFLRKINSRESIGNIFWFFLFATIFLLPLPIIFGFGTVTLPVISLGIISTGAAYLFYNIGFEYVEAGIGNIISNIVSPLFAVVLALVIIHESLNVQVIIGGLILIGAAVYLKVHEHYEKKEIIKK